MASPLSGLREGIWQLAKQKQDRNANQLDQATKYAALAEAGYNVRQQPRGGLFGGSQMVLEQDPNFVSTKALERKKLQGELDDAEFKRSMRQKFGQGGSVGGRNYIYNPYTDKWEEDPEIKERRTAEIKREFELTKPLSGEASKMLSMAEQGLGNAQNIRKIFGLRQGADGVTASPGYKGKVFKMKAANFGAGMNPMLGVAGIIPGAGQLFAGDEGRKLDLYYQTLAENNLRARTGAAATPWEIQREKSRLMARLNDSPELANERLNESDKFLGGTAENIRPGSTAKFGQRQEIAVPEWAAGEEAFYLKSKEAGASDEEISQYLIRKARS